eukprot:symbB.v1.2.015566.t1/scaffold1166.1/size134334/17
MEEKGYEVVWGSGSDECRLLLERIMAAKWAHYNKLSEFFAYACPVMGKPLPQPSDKSFDPATATKRSMATQLFHRASHIAHSAANYSNATVQLFEPRRKKFSAMQLMDDALDESVSAKSPRRRRLTTNERVCCSGKAYNWELGVAAGSSITVSASVSLAAGGFSAWEDKTCVFEKSNIHEVCLNWDFGVDMDGPLEIDVSVARGWFKSYGDMLGRSTFVGANACFIFCIGGSVIQAMNGDVIGGTVEFGFGFPGVDFEGGICQCTRNSGYQKLKFHGLKDRCPSGCFPEDAMVQTAQGSKNMSDLRVGDHVLTVNTAGDLVFEEIYFFGHADLKAFSPMVQLLIQDSNSTASMIELSPDHFLHTCPELRPCLWSQSTAAYAATVVEGAYVWAATDSLNIGRVVSSRFVPKRGLYNPYTLSGNIVVNGVAASAHSRVGIKEVTFASLRLWGSRCLAASWRRGETWLATAAAWGGVDRGRHQRERGLALQAAMCQELFERGRTAPAHGEGPRLTFTCARGATGIAQIQALGIKFDPLQLQHGDSIGHGSFGSVLKAMHPETGMVVGVKEGYIDVQRQPVAKLKVQLENEIDLMSSLRRQCSWCQWLGREAHQKFAGG